MKSLDKVNTKHTWIGGAIALALGAAGTLAANPQALGAIASLFAHPTVSGGLSAAAVLFGVFAVAIGKPPATS